MDIIPRNFFVNKVFAMVMWFTLGIVVAILCICLIFGNFSYFVVSLIYYENTTVFTILLSALIALIFKNMLAAFGVNLIIWIGSIVTYTIFPRWKYIAYYDASNVLYTDLEKYYKIYDDSYVHIAESILYNIIAFALVLVVVLIFSKRWYKNGI